MNGQAPIDGAFNFAQLGKISENALRDVQSDIDRIEAEIGVLRQKQATRKAEADRLRKVIAYLQDPGVTPASSGRGRKANADGAAQRVLRYLASRAQLGGTPAGAAQDAGITASYACALLAKLAGDGAVQKVGYGEYRIATPAGAVA